MMETFPKCTPRENHGKLWKAFLSEKDSQVFERAMASSLMRRLLRKQASKKRGFKLAAQPSKGS